jgi:hypothetical protein
MHEEGSLRGRAGVTNAPGKGAADILRNPVVNSHYEIDKHYLKSCATCATLRPRAARPY